MFRPAGWIERGREKLDRVRPIAERHGLSMIQLASLWNLAHEPVATVVPTLIQEPGDRARPVEQKRAELATLPDPNPLNADEIAEIRAIGDNHGSMALKGATPDHDGERRPDRWPMDAELAELAERWGIDPERDLRQAAAPLSSG
jgi:Ser/Thr protein kinase RdoA (MazF antagonist)